MTRDPVPRCQAEVWDGATPRRCQNRARFPAAAPTRCGVHDPAALQAVRAERLAVRERLARRAWLARWAVGYALPFLRDELLPWLCPAAAPWRPGETALADQARAVLEAGEEGR